MAKTYLCLGAGAGIGLSTAIRFAREGYKAILVSRNPERQKLLAAEFENQTGQIPELQVCDAGDYEQVSKLAEKFPNVDVAHFNAAVLHAQTLQESSYSSLHDDIKIGITGALYMLKAFAPAMLKRQSGTLLLTGGMLADNPLPEYLTLGVAKAGIRNMAQALFEEFKKRHVHIATITVATAVAPKSREAIDIGDLFWQLSAEPEEKWSVEARYAGSGAK